MILKKVEVDGKVVYQPIDLKEAVATDYSLLVFTSEDDEDDYEDLLEEMEEEDDDLDDELEDDDTEDDFVKVLISNKINANKYGIAPLLPFMNKGELDKLIDEIIEGKHEGLSIATVMPFLSKKQCARVFNFAMIDHYYQNQLTAIAPFVDSEVLSGLVDKYVQGKIADICIDGLYPFMSNNDIKRLFTYCLSKRNSTNN